MKRIELLFVGGQHQTTAKLSFVKTAGGMRRERSLKRSDGHRLLAKSVRFDAQLTLADTTRCSWSLTCPGKRLRAQPNNLLPSFWGVTIRGMLQSLHPMSSTNDYRKLTFHFFNEPRPVGNLALPE